MFTARYTSRCAQCDELIEPGDEAGYVDDEVCCEDCAEAAEEQW
jgi:hypothetical protein